MPKKGLLVLVCCKNCNKIKTVFPCVFKKQKNHFCNRKCQGKYVSETRKGKNCYQYNKVTVDCSNPNCGGKVTRKKSQIEKYEENFCNRDCHAEWKSINQTKENHHLWKGRFKVKCSWCGTEKEVKYHLKDQEINFCSGESGRICQGKWRAKYQAGKNASNWQGGIDDHGYGEEFKKPLKRLIRKRDNSLCQFCEKSHKKLNVHHIDYEKENNDSSNLITLCPKCHGKTNHNREGWTQFIFKNYLDILTIPILQ